jgi:hypothetical protein
MPRKLGVTRLGYPDIQSRHLGELLLREMRYVIHSDPRGLMILFRQVWPPCH